MTEGSFNYRGRGAGQNPENRFEKIAIVPVEEELCESGLQVETVFYRDSSRSILTWNDSPDVGFNVSINPYRGCEHGCIYCYARPTHEYFGLSAGLDFESKIFVKEDASQLLRKELSSPKWKPQVIALSGVTDPYQPADRHFQITRRCLEVLVEFGNPVAIVTKNHLVTRDIDLLCQLASRQAAAVNVSVTTLDHELQRAMEPRASTPERRLAAIEGLASAGVPVRVMVAPVIPGLTDHEIPKILEAAHRAGARNAAYILLRLPYAVKDLFRDWLQRHFPEKERRVLSRIREVRDGKLSDPNFHSRMRGKGLYAEQIHALFESSCRKLGMNLKGIALSSDSFKRPGTSSQLDLF